MIFQPADRVAAKLDPDSPVASLIQNQNKREHNHRPPEQ
jgi:hypothetical protein